MNQPSSSSTASMVGAGSALPGGITASADSVGSPTSEGGAVGMLRDFPRSEPVSTTDAASGGMLRDFKSPPNMTVGHENQQPNAGERFARGSSSSINSNASGGGNHKHSSSSAKSGGDGGGHRESWRDRARAAGDIGTCLYGSRGEFYFQNNLFRGSGGVSMLRPLSEKVAGNVERAGGVFDGDFEEDEHHDVPAGLSCGGEIMDRPGLSGQFQLGMSDVGSLTSSRRLRRMSSEEQRGDGDDTDLPANGELGEDFPGSGRNASANSDDDSPPNVVDVQALRRIASQGISDVGSHRAVAWRVLLGYLPPDTSQWESVLNRDRTLYRNLVGELFVKPTIDDAGRHSAKNRRARERKGQEDKDNKVTQIFQSLDQKVERLESAMEKQMSTRSMPVGGKENDINGTVGKRNGRCASPVTISPSEEGTHGANVEVKLDEDEKAHTGASIPSGFKAKKPPSNPMDLLSDLEKSVGGGIDRWSSVEMSTTSAEKRTTSVTSELRNKQLLESKSAPTPKPHVPGMQDGYSGLVPARIREQWKKDGKESIMDNHCNTHIIHSSKSLVLEEAHTGENPFLAMNALLVVDDEGYEPDEGNVDDKEEGKNEDSAFPPRKRVGRRVAINDDPLNKHNKKVGNEGKVDVDDTDDTKWHQFFENAALLDEIRKDVVRTHPDLHFFLEPEDNLGQRRYAALERILFVWAKLNKGVRYVQGMNEIVGTIYFVLANDFNEEWAAEAEADAYFLFNILMVEMRDVFVPDLDEADTGIQGRISNMMSLLSLHDPEVRCHLDDCGIDASFYSIRWLTTLLSREFCLPDTIRLWDSMFASTHKDNFLRYVCVTMVMLIRDKLLAGDFSTCLRLLQSYPPTNVDRMLECSRALWIYESQITLACHKGGISLGQALSTIAPPPGIIMAYGLPGGVASDRITARARQAGERGIQMAKGAAKETANVGKSFFGGAARGLWNRLEGTSGPSASPKPQQKTKKQMPKTHSMPY